MPIPAPVNYQIVPIRHSNSFNRVPTRSLQNLNTFGNNNNNNNTCRSAVDDNNNSNSRFGTLMRNTEERRSPYYYHELTRLHAAGQQQFSPIPSHLNDNDDSFTDFINTIHPETIS
jgi:hypothetical protein